MISALILCGGKATRIKSISLNTPKSLIKIDSKPIIFHQLKYLEKYKIPKVVICLGHKGQMIKKYVASQKFKMKIYFSYDGQNLLGTGGAVKKALKLLEDNFFVLYGDSYLRANLNIIQNYFSKYKKKGLMTIYKNKNKYDKSNVIMKDNKFFYDKNFNNKNLNFNYIDYGINILTKKAFSNFIKKNNFDLSEIFSLLSNKEDLVYKVVYKRFYEVGSFKGIADLRKFLKN